MEIRIILNSVHETRRFEINLVFSGITSCTTKKTLKKQNKKKTKKITQSISRQYVVNGVIDLLLGLIRRDGTNGGFLSLATRLPPNEVGLREHFSNSVYLLIETEISRLLCMRENWVRIQRGRSGSHATHSTTVSVIISHSQRLQQLLFHAPLPSLTFLNSLLRIHYIDFRI